MSSWCLMAFVWATVLFTRVRSQGRAERGARVLPVPLYLGATCSHALWLPALFFPWLRAPAGPESLRSREGLNGTTWSRTFARSKTSNEISQLKRGSSNSILVQVSQREPPQEEREEWRRSFFTYTHTPMHLDALAWHAYLNSLH